jgi:ribonuclease P protein component
MPADGRLFKSDRLLRRSEFRRVYDHGRRESLRLFTVFILENKLGHARLGVTVTKQTGVAVVRNRCKRLVREAFRRAKDAAPGPFDFVINVKRAMIRAGCQDVERELRQLFLQLDQ